MSSATVTNQIRITFVRVKSFSMRSPRNEASAIASGSAVPDCTLAVAVLRLAMFVHPLTAHETEIGLPHAPPRPSEQHRGDARHRNRQEDPQHIHGSERTPGPGNAPVRNSTARPAIRE